MLVNDLVYDAVNVSVRKIMADVASCVALVGEDDCRLGVDVGSDDETGVLRLHHCLPCCVAMVLFVKNVAKFLPKGIRSVAIE